MAPSYCLWCFCEAAKRRGKKEQKSVCYLHSRAVTSYRFLHQPPNTSAAIAILHITSLLLSRRNHSSMKGLYKLPLGSPGRQKWQPKKEKGYFPYIARHMKARKWESALSIVPAATQSCIFPVISTSLFQANPPGI